MLVVTKRGYLTGGKPAKPCAARDSGFRTETVRSEGRPSRSTVLQALTDCDLQASAKWRAPVFSSLLQGINSVAFQSGSCKSDPDCLSAPFPQSTRHKNPRQAANTAVCRGLDFVCSKCECAFEAPLTRGPAAPAHRGGHSDPHRQTPCGWQWPAAYRGRHR